VEGVYTGGYGIIGRGWVKTFDFGFSIKVRGRGGTLYPYISDTFKKL